MILTTLSALGAAFNLGKGIYDQKKSGDKMKQEYDINNQMKQANDEEYYQNYYRNSLDSPTAKGLETNIRRGADKTNKRNDKRNVTGQLSHEQILASNNATNNTVANAVNNIVANQEARQAQESERHIERAKQLNFRDQNLKNIESQQMANSAENLLSSAGDLLTTAGALYNGSNTPSAENDTTELSADTPLKENTTKAFTFKPTQQVMTENAMNGGLSVGTPSKESTSSNGNFKWAITPNLSVGTTKELEEIKSAWDWPKSSFRKNGYGNYNARLSYNRNRTNNY